MNKHFLLLTFLFCLFNLPANLQSKNSDEYSLHINRSSKQFYVIKPDGSVLWEKPCGIGRGGLKQKKTMSDFVTPTGQFTIDIILYEKEKFNAVSDKIIRKYQKDSKYHKLVSSKEGQKFLLHVLLGSFTR